MNAPLRSAPPVAAVGVITTTAPGMITFIYYLHSTKGIIVCDIAMAGDIEVYLYFDVYTIYIAVQQVSCICGSAMILGVVQQGQPKCANMNCNKDIITQAGGNCYYCPNNIS